MAPVLLSLLRLSPQVIPRFRDCFLESDRIVIFTRTGGGNRRYYESEASCRYYYPEDFNEPEPPTGPWNDDLRQHPLYDRDQDDSFDSTYARFYFKFPAAYVERLAELAQARGEQPSFKERFDQVIEMIRNAQVPPKKDV